MQCLGIPIDHRLRFIIREAPSIDTSRTHSEHVHLLYEFGTSLKVDDSDYPLYDLSFALEMARPESKGGVLIALLQPHSKQDNSDGFLAGRRDCATLEAVSDLVTAVNNAKVCFDDTSVFDAIPLLDEAATSADISTIIADAHDVFADMVRVKNPEIVICCFRTESRNTLVRRLCSRGVGWSFHDEKSASNPIEAGLSSIRVNAFHPSYAINHYPIFCSLRRLLTLEFTKAFALLRHKWTEEPWMTSLRSECRQAARNTADGKSPGLLVAITFSISAKSYRTAKDDRNVWSEQYLRARWESLVASLETSFEKCFFRGIGDTGSEEIYDNLASSGITWLCCDIAWILETLGPAGYERLELPSRCLHVFKAWCQKAWPKVQLQHNLSGSGGYYSHLELLLITSNQPNSLSKQLENRFYSLLRDLNLSYEWSRSESLADTYDAFSNSISQGCAFRRFAAAFEDSLESFLHYKLSQKKPGIRQQFSSLSLN
ncbi:hypothetical protein PEX2_065420 [Penicillium expansum]|uniref:Uncharacterized protein n=1 Tax=Penicillium expansum TaxID=27334 RepID=A0A0A2J8Q9_PENEN|nr:hypothetical protein PEX2_065420 [Penicillium expansum]KGO51822.1 hypothetical protein PEX2_065420 [Penicillium expansum]